MHILLIILIAIIGILILTGLFFFYSEVITLFYDFKKWLCGIKRWITRNKKKSVAIITTAAVLSAAVLLIPTGDPPFNSTDNLGYELLDNGTVFHMWNNFNSYYFNRSNGIQFSNHYEEYWTTNVLMLGYYASGTWNLLYRVDGLSGFNEILDAETEDYINVTLWKDLSYGSYDFRLALRYHLKINDSDLTIIPYIKNLGIAIPFEIGFGWEIKDIKIANVTNDNYLWIGNNTVHKKILLNQTLDKSWNDLENNTKINLVCTNPPGKHLSRNLYLSWNKSLNYKVICKSRSGQYNAPTTLFIKVGTLGVNQEKFTMMFWLDADDWLGISSTEFDSACHNGEGGRLITQALDGTDYWKHLASEVHWFILDLGEDYTVKEIRGRSLRSQDPIDVDVYVSSIKGTWGTAVATAISTWQDTNQWQTVDCTDKDGQYIYIEIHVTEAGDPGDIYWGGYDPAFSIIDVYGDIAASNTAPTLSGESPTNESVDISITPSLYVICTDADSDTMNATWRSNSSGSWVDFATNNSISTGTNITQDNSNFSTYSTTYWWSVNLTDGTVWCNETYHFTTIISYNTTIRTNGIDYFVWLGDNTSAWHIRQILISHGFNGGVEYIAVWRYQ